MVNKKAHHHSDVRSRSLDPGPEAGHFLVTTEVDHLPFDEGAIPSVPKEHPQGLALRGHHGERDPSEQMIEWGKPPMFRGATFYFCDEARLFFFRFRHPDLGESIHLQHLSVVGYLSHVSSIAGVLR